MHTRCLLDAVMYQLNAFWGVDGVDGTAARVTVPPGKPTGATAAYFVAVYNVAQGQESKIGFYPRYGCGLTLSGRLWGQPVTDLTSFLQLPRTGFNDTADALRAFLHDKRWQILHWANLLANADPPSQGINTNEVEAAVARQLGPPVLRGPDWWGEATGPVRSSAGHTQEAQAVGFSVDLTFAEALTMQDAPAQY